MKTPWFALLCALASLSTLGTCPAAAADGDPDRVRLSSAHVDIRVLYQPTDETNKLAVVVRDDDAGRTYLSNEVALVAVEAARLTLPPGTEFGDEGDPIWVLPQSQDPGVLYLGLSGESLPGGLFAGEIELRLVEVRGAGSFFLWQAGGFGGFDIRMNTVDGIDAADTVGVSPGGHSHFNWGFTTNGVYEVVLRATGQRAGVATNDFSLDTALRFEVEPLPVEPDPPFVRWQKAQWPGVTDPAVIGPDADPDRDTVVNGVEYALGLDPHQPDRQRLPQPRLRPADTGAVAVLEFQHPVAATDVEFLAWTSPNAAGPAWSALPGPELLAPGQDPEPLAFVAGPVGSIPQFIRLEVKLTR
jgi:surface-anchored protein